MVSPRRGFKITGKNFKKKGVGRGFKVQEMQETVAQGRREVKMGNKDVFLPNFRAKMPPNCKD